MTENSSSKEPTPRQQFNRFVGLGSYAMGVIILGVMVFAYFDSPSSAASDLGSVAIGLAMAFVCFGLGFSTSYRK